MKAVQKGAILAARTYFYPSTLPFPIFFSPSLKVLYVADGSYTGGEAERIVAGQAELAEGDPCAAHTPTVFTILR